MVQLGQSSCLRHAPTSVPHLSEYYIRLQPVNDVVPFNDDACGYDVLTYE